MRGWRVRSGSRVLSLAGAFIAINWVTTQHAASVLRDASWLGRPLFHLRQRSGLRTMVVGRLVDPMVLGSATGAAMGAVRARSALPDGDCDRGFVRCDCNGAAWLVHKRLRPSRFRALGYYT